MRDDSVDYGILGPLVLARDGREIEVRAPRQRTLLLSLLLERNKVVSVDRLIEAVWGDSSPATARKTLQLYVSKLRRTLGDGALETLPAGYVLRVAPGALDADRFEALLMDGRECLTGNPQLAATLLRRALALWRGPALADASYAEFAGPEARRLEELRVVCIEDRIAADLALGRHHDAVIELEGLVGEHPLRERLRAQLMLAYYRSDRQADALAAYRAARETLSDELGLEPGAELRALEAAILRQEVGPGPSAPPQERDAGLPHPVTRLVGRERELSDLSALIARPDVRFVSLVGAGGSGKTRLAIALGHAVRDAFANGVVFVELAALRDPELVVPAIARACGVADTGDDLLANLGGWLAERELLLIVDNVEHVASAAAYLAALVARAPRLTLLATSRFVLHLSGEHVYPVAPLPTDDAVALFVARARAAGAGLEATAAELKLAEEICERLDGLPLAVELAAARARTLSLPRLLERLEQRLPVLIGGPRDLPARQQTLRSTLEWSSDLLDDDTRQLFARLAVFPGSFALDAAESVCEASLEGLETLIDASLLGSTGERFSMLGTVREHAAELLESTPSGPGVRTRHAWHFVALAAGTDFKGAGTGRSLAAVDADLHNYRAALAWSREVGDDELTLRIATGLRLYWYLRGMSREGSEWLRGPVERGAGGEQLQAPGHWALAGLTFILGDLDEAEALAWRGIRIGLAAGMLDCAMGCHTVLGLVALARGDLDGAREHIRRSEELAKELGRDHDVYVALNNLGEIEYAAGNLAAARALWEECLAWVEEQGIGEPAFSHLGLGAVAHAEGRLDDAERHFSTALARAEAGQLHDLTALALIRKAALQSDRGNHVEATLTLGRASAYVAATRDEPTGEEAHLYDRTRTAAIAALGPEQHAQLLAASNSLGI